MEKYFESPKPKVIYVFRITDSNHKGCVKVGETTLDDDSVNPFLAHTIAPNSSVLNKAARHRIDQYTQTAGIPYELLYTEIASYPKAKGISMFQDKDVHAVLNRSGIKRKQFDSTAKQGREWFITDLETVKRAIVAVKEGRESLSPGEITQQQMPIEFRPEQAKAIKQTIERFHKGNKMLWNAKMRFGKTLSALQVAKEMDFSRTLILTHRPVVDEGWFEDFHKIFYDRTDFDYGSKKKGSSFENLEKRHKQKKLKYVYFASMQDLRGSGLVGGKFDKNDEIFTTDWEYIIIDEAHEGTQTALGQAVITELTKPTTKVLQLSGTAFNLMDEYVEDEVFTWDYTMEQRAKEEWDKNHFGDPNPYAGLPRLNIYTYDLGRLLLKDDFNDEEIAFNFREFFRTKEDGRFVHSDDITRFLNLLSKDDPDSMYPFANLRYRQIFRHTLWMLPGVKEARALSKLLRQHPVFGSFEIVNVAGYGDEEESHEEALKKVNNAIRNHPDGTITLSCGRLTTGVSVPQWMGVLMLAGSFNTAASAYMQTIFRVQTPYSKDGLVKEDCYVFDFAPDRTLQVLATVPRVSTKAGKTTGEQKKALGEFLNFCPVIGMAGSQMKPYDVDQMMQQLKKAYVERVVRNGFEDGFLYNDELLKLDGVALEEFKNLKEIIGTTKAMARSGEVDVNKQGLTNEEYEEIEDLKKKKKKELTEEEKKRLEELREKKKARDTAISILRGISIRMPLLIYGAEITDEDTQLTIDNFTSLIDDQSWEEFMPKGVTKEVFEKFKKYYDDDIFASAGKRIRAMARAADRLTVEERIERISGIFNTFRNPDKETVLTPWRVVNMHLGDTIGGYNFYNEDYSEPIAEPRYIDHHRVTDEVFTTGDYLLEINSKSGLYPLYLAYNLYRRALKEEMRSPQTLEQHQAIWDKVVRDSIFVICKTPMAKAVTRRTLMGFRQGKVNTRYFEDLINQIKNKPENFLSKVIKGKSFWKANNNDNMKFKAIVGNPPYQIMDGGTDRGAIPVYNYFVEIAKKINPAHISMIMPARWYAGGRGLDDFRSSMMHDRDISELFDYELSKDLFPTVDIAGGLCIILWSKGHNSQCRVVNNGALRDMAAKRFLDEFDILIRSNAALPILRKVSSLSTDFLTRMVLSINPFGFRTYFRGSDKGDIKILTSQGWSKINRSTITKGLEYVDSYKIIVGRFVPSNGEMSVKPGDGYRVITDPKILYPKEINTETYIDTAVFPTFEEANNYRNFLTTKFVRFLLRQGVTSVNVTKECFTFVPCQDFTSESDIDWTRSISEIDQQLYKKYALTNEEIAFIESMIKPMQ